MGAGERRGGIRHRGAGGRVVSRTAGGHDGSSRRAAERVMVIEARSWTRPRRNPTQRHGDTEDARRRTKRREGSVTEGLWRRAARGTNRQAVRIQVVNVDPAPLVFARLDLFVRPAEGGRATGPPCVLRVFVAPC